MRVLCDRISSPEIGKKGESPIKSDEENDEGEGDACARGLLGNLIREWMHAFKLSKIPFLLSSSIRLN